MPGTITYTSPAGGGIPVSRPSTGIGVFRWNGPEGGDPELLVNIRCLSVQYREGPDPWAARFRYVQSQTLSADFPRRFEQMFPIDSGGPGVVLTDDRLIVVALLDSGDTQLLFDGFAQIPQADLDGDTEMVTFVALGTPIREYDTPLAGQLIRDATEPGVVSDLQTDEPTRFNPNGWPNASPKDADSGDDPRTYPTFLGPLPPLNAINGRSIRMWTLGMAARYIIVQGNTARTYINYTDLAYLDNVLRAVVAVGGDTGSLDLNDPSTYTFEDIEVQDIDVTGEPWPVALSRIIEPHGFAMRWLLDPDDNGLPRWSFIVYRKDDNASVKSLNLQIAGNRFNPGATNLGGLSLARDTHDLANRLIVDTRPILVEASFVLAPLFNLGAADVTIMDEFIATNENDTADNGIKYRRFGFDECGEGHYDFATASFVKSEPGSFKLILTLGAIGRATSVRRRPGRDRLVTQDKTGKRVSARLHVSTDYQGTAPVVWDGSDFGHWQRVHSGEWKLLDDRLGIQLTCQDPNSFSIGDPPNAALTPSIPAGTLNLVEQLATPDKAKGRPLVYFLLTTAVYADQGILATADRRTSSPTRFTITRRVDRRDQFKKEIISKYSILTDAGDLGVNDTVETDDTEDAQDVADGYRRSREAGRMAGSATIGSITAAYGIGDKIAVIAGRNVSLRTNAGAGDGESAIFPSIVSISIELDGRQSVNLELTDYRAEPAPRRSRRTEE